MMLIAINIFGLTENQSQLLILMNVICENQKIIIDLLKEKQLKERTLLEEIQDLKLISSDVFKSLDIRDAAKQKIISLLKAK